MMMTSASLSNTMYYRVTHPSATQPTTVGEILIVVHP